MEIEAKHIYKVYEAIAILKDISFSLERGQKVGLVGNNGVGKSTLLKILAGIIEPDQGAVITRKGLVISYMPQDTSIIANETIRDYLLRVSGIGILEEQMETSAKAIIEYEHRNGYSFDHKMKLILAGFGLSEVNNDRLINTLSSGQKSKVLMVGVLLSDADLLLLDEPTNNLDLPALIWFEDFLKRLNSACIIVSHDRLFLDRIVSKIFEIDWRTRALIITHGRYSDYLERKEKELERQAMAYEAQQDEIKRLGKAARDKRTEAIQGARFVGTDRDKFRRGFKRDRASKSGKTAKAIEKRIEQMELIEKPIEREVFRIHIRPLRPEGSKDIVLKEVVAGYTDNNFRIGPISVTVSYGNRVVILGLNGSGKSTLLKTINNELEPLAGEVKIGNGLVVGNLMQEHDNLPAEESLKNFFIKRGNMSVQEAYGLAAQFGFSAEEINKKIKDFSPGGRSRILFALFSALSVNVLLLDEPTNHLDIEALNALEEAVAHYEGIIVLVSHDRYFLQEFRPTDTYLLADGKLMRQQSFEVYLSNAERKAKRLIN